MATYYSVRNGDLSLGTINNSFGLSLSSSEVINSNTTDSLLLTSFQISPTLLVNQPISASYVALNTSNRNSSPSGTLDLTITLTKSNTATTSTSQSYPISSFSTSNSWNLLKLPNALSANPNERLIIAVKTSQPNQLSVRSNFSTLTALDDTRNNLIASSNNNFTLSAVTIGGVTTNAFYLSGSGTNWNWMSIPASSLFNFNGDFTIEFWINCLNSSTSVNETGTTVRVINFGADVSNGLSIEFSSAPHNASNRISLYTSSMLLEGTSAVADGNWHHVAVTRNANTLKLFVDGGQSGLTVTNNTTIFNVATATPIYIGSYNGTNSGRVQGYIANLRIIKDLAVYTNPFTVPSIQSVSATPETIFLLKDGIINNFNRMLINEPTSAASGGNHTDLYVGGLLLGSNVERRTITADNFTLSSFIINNNSSVNFPLTSNKTLTIVGSAGLQINSGGTLNIGTFSNPILSSITHTILLSNTNFTVAQDGILNIYGSNKTPYSYLSLNSPANTGRFITSQNLSSNWLSGDNILFTNNVSGLSTFDSLILSGFENSNTFRTTTNTTFLHNSLSSNPYIPSISNLTRNVRLSGIGNSNIYISGGNDNIFNTQFNITNLLIDNRTLSTTNFYNNVFNINSFNFGSSSSYINLDNNIFYKNNINISNNSNFRNSNLTNNLILSNINTGLILSNLSCENITMSGNYVTGLSGVGALMQNCSGTGTLVGASIFNGTRNVVISGSNSISVGNIIAVSGRQEGIYVDTSLNLNNTIFTNITSIGNTLDGVLLSGNNLNALTPITVNINGLVSNNNNDSGIQMYNITGNLSNITVNNNRNYGIKTSIGNGPTIFNRLTSIMSISGRPISVNVAILSGFNNYETVITNAYLSTVSASNAALTANGSLLMDSVRFTDFGLDNSILSSTTNLQLLASRNLIEGSYYINNSRVGPLPVGAVGLNNIYQPGNSKNIGFAYTNFNQIAGSNITYTNGGQRTVDTIFAISDSDKPSERLTPNNSLVKLRSGSVFVALSAGDSVIVSVYVRRDSTYNGNTPRLILKSNPSIGINNDIILATSTSFDTFDLLNGSSPVVANTGVLEFYVDCDGTSGFINVDNWDAR